MGWVLKGLPSPGIEKVLANENISDAILSRDNQGGGEKDQVNEQPRVEGGRGHVDVVEGHKTWRIGILDICGPGLVYCDTRWQAEQGVSMDVIAIQVEGGK